MTIWSSLLKLEAKKLNFGSLVMHRSSIMHFAITKDFPAFLFHAMNNPAKFQVKTSSHSWNISFSEFSELSEVSEFSTSPYGEVENSETSETSENSDKIKKKLFRVQIHYLYQYSVLLSWKIMFFLFILSIFQPDHPSFYIVRFSIYWSKILNQCEFWNENC